MIIATLNKTTPDHLVEVIGEMRQFGRPQIRVVYWGDDLYLAIEGSHRLAAAQALGLAYGPVSGADLAGALYPPSGDLYEL